MTKIDSTFADSTEVKDLQLQLAHALERAEEAERMRDDVLAMAGHEMRTPLTALMLHLESLHRLGEVQPNRTFSAVEVRDRVNRPLSQAKRLGDMLDRLLDTSRIRTTTMSLQLEPVDVSLLLAATVQRFEAAARAAGSRIQLDAPESVVAYLDSLRMEQVLSNLMSNAIKYGRGSPITLRLRTEAEHFTIEVADHGEGISPENQERIFERYARASSSHSAESLGLGLYILREIVKSHGGTVAVESQLGRGARFIAKLPLRKIPGV